MIGQTCANPDCFNYPMRGDNLCADCSTKRDCIILMGIMAGASLLYIAWAKAFL